MIKLSDHRVAWSDEFRRLGGDLRKVLGAAARRIDHIGSTSVPSLCAKDIIDIQVTTGARETVAALLREAGFVERTEVRTDHVPPGYAGPEGDWAKVFFTERLGERRANVHVREAGKPNQRYALLFRDYLRSHPDTAEAYGELKRRLARSLTNPDDYPDVKDPAVDLIYLAAEAWVRQSGWQPGPSDA